MAGNFEIVNSYFLVLTSYSFLPTTECTTHCWMRKLNMNRFRLNTTLNCDMYFQWTVNDFCCYDKYDRAEDNPFCCRSEMYKLVVAIGFFTLILIMTSCFIFLCWVYNLPHHILYLLTCKKFNLNNWLVKNRNGPYVDQSYYSGEPFWTRGTEVQPYPLRPLPPRIFYPVPPNGMKFRWDVSHDQLPLFILASRQFTRNPYSARPMDHSLAQNNVLYGKGQTQNRSQYSAVPAINSGANNTAPNSRRSSITSFIFDSNKEGNDCSNADSKNSRKFDFKIHVDEGEATTELLQVLQDIEDTKQMTRSNRYKQCSSAPQTPRDHDVNSAEENKSGCIGTISSKVPNRPIVNFSTLNVPDTSFSINRRRATYSGNIDPLSLETLGDPTIQIARLRRHSIGNLQQPPFQNSTDGGTGNAESMPLCSRIRYTSYVGQTMPFLGMETIIESLDDDDDDENFNGSTKGFQSSIRAVKRTKSRVRTTSAYIQHNTADNCSSSNRPLSAINNSYFSKPLLSATMPFNPDLPGTVPSEKTRDFRKQFDLQIEKTEDRIIPEESDTD